MLLCGGVIVYPPPRWNDEVDKSYLKGAPVSRTAKLRSATTAYLDCVLSVKIRYMRVCCPSPMLACCVVLLLALAPVLFVSAYAESVCDVSPLTALISVSELVSVAYGDLPIFQVVSGSMEPQYMPGDLVVVNGTHPFSMLSVGDVIMFWDPRYDVGERPVVHRVVSFDAGRAITRGDANPGILEFDWANSTTYIGLVHPEPYHPIRAVVSPGDPVLIRFGSYDLGSVGLDGCPYFQAAVNGTWAESMDISSDAAVMRYWNGGFGWVAPVEEHPLLNVFMFSRAAYFAAIFGY